jgi:hypothetical protein
MNQLTTLQRITIAVVALTLLVACAAKVFAMVSSGSLATRTENLFNVLLIQIELTLALWLLSGYRQPLSFATSAVFFLCAIASNVRAIWLNKTSCGCFGNIEIPPEMTVCLNIGFLVAIASSLRCSKLANFTSALKFGRDGWIIPLGVFALLGAAIIQFGRIHYAPKQLAMPDSIDLGVIELGEQKEISIPLKNVTGKEINIWGGKTNCSCASIDGLPAVLPGGAEKEIRILVRPSNLRDINVRTILYVDSGISDSFIEIEAKVHDSNVSK